MKDKKENQRETIILEVTAWSSVISIIFILAKITFQF